MSGIVGIFHRDGAPVQPTLLQSLTDFLAYRGPDSRATWSEGSVGLGHAMLCTTHESRTEFQPAELDGQYWITADARLDGRAELIAELLGARRDVRPTASDSELILRAFANWGTTCVEHLRGDFSFALWDAGNKQLFCARDHFGIKPFYYASLGPLVIFSNTLDCIRQHPAVSGRLNDLAITDFLLFDMIRETAATSFADIQRLPPAHTLMCDEVGISVRRYWVLSVSTPIHHKNPSECVEQFRELLDRAVGDRLRTNSAGVLMSGGLDSPTVAASAQRTLARDGAAAGLCAYTEVFEKLIPHEERRYAGLVAEALKIPIEFHVNDGSDKDLWKSLNHEDNRWPEPVHSPGSDGGLAQMRQLAARSRVALTGFGGDPALSSLLSVYFLRLLKEKQFGRALVEAMQYLAAEGRLSRLYLHTRWRRWFASKSQAPCYPGWLNRDLEKRLGLRERWEALTRDPRPNEAVRPVAYEAMADPMWPVLFEGYDPGLTRIPVEVRYPFFDLRLVDFLLALPALPWCSDKELLREAGRNVLPDAVRLRRKSPLLADPLVALLQQTESAWVDSFVPVPKLGRYVVRQRIPRVSGEKDAWNAWIHLRPLSLNFWLRSQEATG
ncbi:MAG TPA: asparagine synthase-related protein [Candidatus Acidoferrum sp.]|nr:asparagine synthase-related protein [Candidatus Acidoferrum sp.]